MSVLLDGQTILFLCLFVCIAGLSCFLAVLRTIGRNQDKHCKKKIGLSKGQQQQKKKKRRKKSGIIDGRNRYTQSTYTYNTQSNQHPNLQSDHRALTLLYVACKIIICVSHMHSKARFAIVEANRTIELCLKKQREKETNDRVRVRSIDSNRRSPPLLDDASTQYTHTDTMAV